MIETVVDFIKEYPVVGIPVVLGLALLLAEALFQKRK